MSVKEQALELIRKLPDDCTIEDIQYRINLLEGVEAGLRDIKEGRVIPHEEVKRRLAEWRAMRGQSGGRESSSK